MTAQSCEPSGTLSARDRLFDQYNRPIVHLRERFAARRLGLIFGAGISADLGFPGWTSLLDRIEASFKNRPYVKSDKDDPLRHAQLLFQHYCRYERPDAQAEGMMRREDVLRIGWLRLVHDCLYKNVPANAEDLEARSPYLRHFVPLIRGGKLAINYNFDDTLERLLARDADSRDEPRRGYTSLWGGTAQTPSTGGTIYHPNGFLPSQLPADQPSEDLVLLQTAFADQLIDSAQGRYTLLTGYLSEMTCLIVGSSLTDPTLQHVLRHTAQIHPGHIHYFIRLVRQPGALTEERRRAEFDANFAVYNVFTLFLSKEEYATLAILVGADESAFASCLDASAAALGKPLFRKYIYFLVGSSGVGKTTSLRHFHSLRPHPEWLDPLPEIMTRNFGKLTAEELQAVDDWVDREQWRRKNRELALSDSGIDIVDRGPLDALAYVPREAIPDRARHALALIPSDGAPIVSGHVIRLHGRPERILAQARRVFRTHDLDGLGGIRWQQDMIEEVYSQAGRELRPDSIEIDELTPAEVARRIAQIIHIRPYRPVPLGDLLRKLASDQSGAYQDP